MPNLPTASRFITNAIRIETVAITGNIRTFGTGSGMVFRLPLYADQRYAACVIVTNRHVMANATAATIVLSTIPQGCELDARLMHPLVEHHRVTIDQVQERVLYHPDQSVDLCAVNFSNEYHATVEKGRILRCYMAGPNITVPAEAREMYQCAERIIMIGYPNGLYDEVNNLPLVRTGMTASHPFHRWRGLPQFVIDCACFPGSSGSPVFLFEEGFVRTGPTSVELGHRVQLLGFLYAGPVIETSGRISIAEVPTAAQPIPIVGAMMNLGYVVSADELTPLFETFRRAPPQVR